MRKEAISVTIKVPDEAASADGEAATSSLEDPAKIIHEGDYTEQQIFNVDKTTFYYKMLPRTFIEKSVPVFKALKGTG